LIKPFNYFRWPINLIRHFKTKEEEEEKKIYKC